MAHHEMGGQTDAGKPCEPANGFDPMRPMQDDGNGPQQGFQFMRESRISEIIEEGMSALGVARDGPQGPTVDSLLEVAITYWSAIGQSSLAGFRGNWLLRAGTMSEAADHYDLRVEKRAYDILLARAPFSFSVVKLPWMAKPVNVTWPY